MNNFGFLNTTALITVFVILLFAFFLLTVETKSKLKNKLFATLLLLSAFDLSGFFSENYFNNTLSFEVFRMTTSLLIMPVFYLYVKSVCYSDFKLKQEDLVLIIPFAFANLILIPRFYFANTEESVYVFEHFRQMSEIQFFYILVELQYIFYIVLIFKILKTYKETYLENFTNSDNSSYKWLFQMTVLFLMAHSVVFFKSLIRYTDYQALLNGSNVIIGIVALFISCWFVIKALNNPELFKGVDSIMLLVNDELNKKVILVDEDVSKNFKSPEIISQMELVKKYVLENEPYLEPSLTIQELSKQVGVSVRDLSILINHHMDKHFFDFINEYRIEKAKEILKDVSKSKVTILEILYEVGFNSKSSFNTAFKKHTNQTPTEFRNS